MLLTLLFLQIMEINSLLPHAKHRIMNFKIAIDFFLQTVNYLIKITLK